MQISRSFYEQIEEKFWKKNQVHKSRQNKFLVSHPRTHHFLVAHRERFYHLYTLFWYLNLVFLNRCLVSKSCRAQILLYFYPVIVRSINYQLQKCKCSEPVANWPFELAFIRVWLFLSLFFSNLFFIFSRPTDPIFQEAGDQKLTIN